MDRTNQLRQLEMSLDRLVEILRLDPRCQWLPHFDSCLQQTRQLLQEGFTQEQLNGLSSSVMHVYGGMGSFNDYGPGIYDSTDGRYSPIPGAGDFEAVSTQVHEQALTLRVVANAL